MGEEQEELTRDSYIKESARRAAERSKNLMQEGQARTEQEQIDKITEELLHRRIYPKPEYGEGYSIQYVADRIDVEVYMFSNFEAGWVTKDELLEVIDKWAPLFNKDPEEYRQMLSSPTE